jgi:hypothetical protein
MASSVAPNIVTDGLVFAYDAANVKSYSGTGTSVKDISGNGNDGTLTNGPLYDSTYKGAFDLDGSNDDITTPITAANWVDIPFTIQMWTSDCTINDSVFVMGSDGASNNFGLVGAYWSTADRIFFYWRASNPIASSLYITVPHDRTAPNNICVTFTGVGGVNTTTIKDNTTIYLNGVSHSVSTGGGAGHLYNSRLLLGGGNYPLNGKIHNTYYYNRALSAEEVLQNYNTTKSRFI